MPRSDADIGYRWKPIEPLDAIASSYDFGEIDSLQRQWLSIRKRREESNPQAYNTFLERLNRSWAIETGIIEGLYTLDRGVTETLVQRGFNAELIDPSASNKEPAELVRVLEDHQQAAEGVYRYISQGSPLTKSFIRQLHVILTEHLPTYIAYDQFGNRFETPLDRGGFKTLPNNPTRLDSRIHEYCPPVQVDSEIDNLVELHHRHRAEGYHSVLIAAWLHHAFTQIHPFQDGNGRVARALLTWHLVRENYLSVVVSRDNRSAYIDALEAADDGNLDAFVDFLVQLEKRTIQGALAEVVPTQPSRKVEQAIENIAGQVRQRVPSNERHLRSVTSIGYALAVRAEEFLKAQGEHIKQGLLEADLPVGFDAEFVGEDRRAVYTDQVVGTAQEAGHWANFNQEHFLIRSSIAPERQRTGGYPGLAFLVSLHHTGRSLSGVMAATAFAQIEFWPRGIVHLSTPPSPNYHNCAASPFTFVWDNDAEEITPRFINWLEEALSEALRYWQEFLT